MIFGENGCNTLHCNELRKLIATGAKKRGFNREIRGIREMAGLIFLSAIAASAKADVRVIRGLMDLIPF